MSQESPSKKRRIIGWVAYGFLCVAALTVGAGLGWMNRSTVVTEFVRQTVSNTPPEQVFQEDSITVLLLGLDENRAPGGRVISTREGTRSDSILLAKVDFHRKEITAISIPRDLMVSAQGYRVQRINGFHAIGGKSLTKAVVENLLGIHIDRVIVVNYDAFAQMVDTVGGVEVEIERRMRYRDRRGDLDINFSPGVQTLNGQLALDYVRYRSDGSDFNRMARQQGFMVAFRDALEQNPTVIPEISNLALDFADNQFNARELAALLKFAREVGTDSIRTATLPVVDYDRNTLQLASRTEVRETLRELNFLENHTASNRLP